MSSTDVTLLGVICGTSLKSLILYFGQCPLCCYCWKLRLGHTTLHWRYAQSDETAAAIQKPPRKNSNQPKAHRK